MRAFFVRNFGAKNYKAETFRFETFCRKDIGEKHLRKMLMKLTPYMCSLPKVISRKSQDCWRHESAHHLQRVVAPHPRRNRPEHLRAQTQAIWISASKNLYSL